MIKIAILGDIGAGKTFVSKLFGFIGNFFGRFCLVDVFGGTFLS